jgi:hypothetical protein
VSETAKLPVPDRGLGALVCRAIAEMAETREIVLRGLAERGELGELAIALTRLAGALEAAAMFAEITEQLYAVPATPRHRRHAPGRQHPLMRVV